MSEQLTNAKGALDALFGYPQNEIDGLFKAKAALGVTWVEFGAMVGIKPNTIEKMASDKKSNRREVPDYVKEEIRAHMLNILGELPEWLIALTPDGTNDIYYHNTFPRAIVRNMGNGRIEVIAWLSRVGRLGYGDDVMSDLKASFKGFTAR